jgi:hypothetical protein
MFEYLNDVQYFCMDVVPTYIVDLRTRSELMPFSYYHELKMMISGAIMCGSQIIVYMNRSEEECFQKRLDSLLQSSKLQSVYKLEHTLCFCKCTIYF